MNRTMYRGTGFRKSGLSKPLAEEIFRVTGRTVLKLGEYLVAALPVEPERLAAVGIERGGETAWAHRVGLGCDHQFSAVALAAPPRPAIGSGHSSSRLRCRRAGR